MDGRELVNYVITECDARHEELNYRTLANVVKTVEEEYFYRHHVPLIRSDITSHLALTAVWHDMHKEGTRLVTKPLPYPVATDKTTDVLEPSIETINDAFEFAYNMHVDRTDNVSDADYGRVFHQWQR